VIKITRKTWKDLETKALDRRALKDVVEDLCLQDDASVIKVHVRQWETRLLCTENGLLDPGSITNLCLQGAKR
jgi:hypothetical protein